MLEPESVDAYLEGRVSAWAFVRRLVRAGVSIGTAITFTTLLPAAVQRGDFSPVERLIAQTAEQDPERAALLDRLMRRVAGGLVRIEGGGSQNQLGRSLNMLGLRAARNDVKMADLNFMDDVRNVPVDVTGRLDRVEPPAPNTASAATTVGGNQSFALSLDGTVGEMPLNLAGFIDVNPNTQGARAPRVRLNIVGNMGDTPIQFNK